MNEDTARAGVVGVEGRTPEIKTGALTTTTTTTAAAAVWSPRNLSHLKTMRIIYTEPAVRYVYTDPPVFRIEFYRTPSYAYVIYCVTFLFLLHIYMDYI